MKSGKKRIFERICSGEPNSALRCLLFHDRIIMHFFMQDILHKNGTCKKLENNTPFWPFRGPFIKTIYLFYFVFLLKKA